MSLSRPRRRLPSAAAAVVSAAVVSACALGLAAPATAAPAASPATTTAGSSPTAAAEPGTTAAAEPSATATDPGTTAAAESTAAASATGSTAAPATGSTTGSTTEAPPAEVPDESHVSRTDRPAVGVTRTSFTAVNYCGREDFADVPVGSSFYDPISWMACERISVGYTDNTFRKSREVTRGELAAFLYRQVQPNYTADSIRDFADVAVGGANFEAISWFASARISVGYSDGTFRPGDPVTRGELAGFLLRLAGDGTFKAPATSPFTDMSPSSAFYRAATWLRAEGITAGYADGSFGPSRAVVRAETAAFLAKVDALLVPAGESVYQPGSTTEIGVWGQEAAANMGQWCSGMALEAAKDQENWAMFEAWWTGDGLYVEELIHLSMLDPMGKPLHPDHALAVAVQYHECGHILQYRAYGYDAEAMDDAMNRVYGNSNGTEHMADCISDAMGAERVGRLNDYYMYEAGYGGKCTSAHLDAAKKIMAGQRV